MISRTYKTEPIKDNPHMVDVRKLYDEPSAQIMHITLQAGESLKPHKTPVDVAFYVLEGSPTIRIDHESVSMGADTLVESPAHLIHCISNEGPEIARILVIKAPRPETATKVL
jgi:mannose-6-phosphate isomerase-like protein (cupin superfamily)